MRRAKFLALVMFLALFSALGAYVQFEQGNWALAVMYVVLTPIVTAFCCLMWRSAIADWRSGNFSSPDTPKTWGDQTSARVVSQQTTIDEL
jgi:hypothetical protein